MVLLSLATGTFCALMVACQSGSPHTAEFNDTVRVAHEAEDQSPKSETVQHIHQGQIPGNRTIIGTVESVRGGQIRVNIGNPQPLFLPLRSAQDKAFSVDQGDRLEIVMNDHNAIVDYHPVDAAHQDHMVIEGELAQALTVGHDTATIRTAEGDMFRPIASRARSKLSAIPVGAQAVFLIDETGEIVDAQLRAEGVAKSKQREKPPIKGAHERLEATYLGSDWPERIRVRLKDGKEHDMPLRGPLETVRKLEKDQFVVLLMDTDGYVVEVASSDVPNR